MGRGEQYHRDGHHPVDLAATIGIIGTGSSAIQSIPIIAESAAHLTVSGTANLNGTTDPLDEAMLRIFDPTTTLLERAQMFAGFGADQARSDLSVFEVTDEERETRFEVKWQECDLDSPVPLATWRSQPANQIAAEFVRDKIEPL